jgi:hypothetical protein
MKRQKYSKYDGSRGAGKPSEAKFSDCFTCGFKDHCKADCNKGGQQIKKVANWHEDVKMLTLFRDRFKDTSVNFIDAGRRSLYLHTYAFSEVFVVTKKGGDMLTMVYTFLILFQLGLTAESQNI